MQETSYVRLYAGSLTVQPRGAVNWLFGGGGDDGVLAPLKSSSAVRSTLLSDGLGCTVE